MMHVMDMRHPRRVKEGKMKSFSWCGTKTGWHCLCKSLRHSDLKELGVGVVVYFKMLKFLMCLFAWFIILSIPAYFFYYSG